VRWIVNFAGWTVGGVVVNSGLKYTEALIELEMRLRLTTHAHDKYMVSNNFDSAGLRICAFCPCLQRSGGVTVTVHFRSQSRSRTRSRSRHRHGHGHGLGLGLGS
jgi:hypothetical protein